MERQVRLFRALVKQRGTDEEWKPVKMQGLSFYSTYNEINRMVLESVHWLPHLEFKLEEVDLSANEDSA